VPFYEDEWWFDCYDEVFDKGLHQQGQCQKFTIPISERLRVLSLLDEHNLNAFSLFGSEESMMETLAAREFRSFRYRLLVFTVVLAPPQNQPNRFGVQNCGISQNVVQPSGGARWRDAFWPFRSKKNKKNPNRINRRLEERSEYPSEDWHDSLPKSRAWFPLHRIPRPQTRHRQTR
jgi:hypothetical protein